MKKCLITLAALTILALPSIGQAETIKQAKPGPYFSLFLGVSIPNDAEVNSYDYFFGGAFKDNVSFDPGVYTGATMGYDFGMLRLEAELSYRYSEIDSVTDQFTGYSYRSVNGDLGVLATMFNAFVDFHNSSQFTPYLGGGIGFAYLDLSDTTGDALLLYGNGDDTVFAYQFGAGVDIALNRNLSLDLGYRYFATSDANINAYNYPMSTDFKFESHNATVGLRFKF